MRRAIEDVQKFQNELVDGVKIFVDGSWVLMLPDPDEATLPCVERRGGQKPCAGPIKGIFSENSAVAKLTRTILVVDDDPTGRALLREILVEVGYNVLEAEDGEFALELLEKRPVDLLITDRAMPRLDGLELLAKLKEKELSIPSLVISAYGEETLWGQAIGLGAVDYLLKPFKAEDVLKIVSKALGKKS